MAEIAGYEFGRVTVDGREETRDVIVLPERVVRDWWRKDGHGLVLEDLDAVLDELPAHLVVGTGAYGRLRPDPGTIAVDRHDTKAAFRPCSRTFSACRPLGPAAGVIADHSSSGNGRTYCQPPTSGISSRTKSSDSRPTDRDGK